MMKKTLLTMLLFSNAIIANAQSEWSNWITVYNESSGSIAISFKLNSKESICKGLGYSFYRVQNTFSETVQGKIYFDFPNCDGGTSTEWYPFFYEGPEISQNDGLNFFGYIGGGVNNIRITGLRFLDREKAKEQQQQAQQELQEQKQKAQQQAQQQYDQQQAQQKYQKQAQQKQQDEYQRQQQIAENQRIMQQRQQQLQAQMQALENQRQANQNVINAVGDGITAMTNLFQKQAAERAARAEQARIEAEQKRLAEEKVRLGKEAAEQAERDRINGVINQWKAESQDVIPSSLQAYYTKMKNMNDITDPNLKSVYFIIWNFNKDASQIKIANPIEIKKSPDGDWPIITDLFKKIESETGLVVNQTPDKVPVKDNALNYLLGYFTSEKEALDAIVNLKTNAYNNGFDIEKSDTNKEPEKKASTINADFWKE